MIYALLVLALVAQAGDVYTTLVGLNLGLKEGNPIGRFFSRFLGPYWPVYAKLPIVAIIAAVWTFAPSVLPWVLLVAIAAGAWAMYHNYKLIEGVKSKSNEG